MRFVAPCGHEGVPVTANFVTCEVCDRLPMKAEVVAEVKPTLTWRTREQFHAELTMAISNAFGGNLPIDPSSLCWRLAENQSHLLYELQEFVKNTFPKTFP